MGMIGEPHDGLAGDPDEAEELLPDNIEGKQGDGQEKDRENHDDRRTDQFIFAGPGDLVHFRFDRNQEVGEPRPVDDAVAKPDACSQQHRWDSRNQVGTGIKRPAECSVERPASQRDDNPERQRGQLTDNPPLVRFVHRSLK